MAYLLKVTAIWTIFLLLFELVYKSSGRFTLNRLYLLLAVITGLLLPFVPLPSGTVAIAHKAQMFYAPVLNQTSANIAMTGTQTSASAATTSSWDAWHVLSIVYIAGIALLCSRVLLELLRIMRLKSHSQQLIIAQHKIFVTGKEHAPYSFFSWIFISDVNCYKPAELEFILLHEAAHLSKKHWLDLLLMQVFVIVLWFHPLIWRSRYLLQLQHEYEADQVAARHDAYAYGRFLLQQALLGGVPQIAHSFHFSPIKNRINMLTKTQSRLSGTRKYFLFIPAMFVCTVLMADTVWQNNITTFKGNKFAWRETDTLYYNKDKNRAELASASGQRKAPIIYSMNDEPVYQNEYLHAPATNLKGEQQFIDYLIVHFHELNTNTPDSLTGIQVKSIVIDKEGKVVNYDIRYLRHAPKGYPMQPEWDPLANIQPQLNNVIEKIIANAPSWKPAHKDGKPVNSVISFMPVGC
ncbi:MAG: M56 family metallopeptidase [Flavipsychrobacter sp.]